MNQIKLIDKIKTIQVIMGYGCNLDCPYCIQKSFIEDRQEKHTLCAPVLTALFQLYKAFPNKLSGEMRIELIGGEPLLYPEIIKGVVKLSNQMYEREKRHQLCYYLLSNCHLLVRNEKLIHWIQETGANFEIMPSFDDKFKNPHHLDKEAWRILDAYPVFATYVIDGEKAISDALYNIHFLNDHGIKPRIFWNYHKLNDLNTFSTRKKVMHIFKTCEVRIEQGFSGNINQCGWVGITPQGRILSCNDYCFGGVDLKEGLKFTEENCKLCKYKKWCHRCLVHRSHLKGAICNWIKILYAVNHGMEVE